MSENHEYWGRVEEAVQRLDDFPENQAGLKANYFHYWAHALDGRCADWDDYQMVLADVKLGDEKTCNAGRTVSMRSSPSTRNRATGRA